MIKFYVFLQIGLLTTTNRIQIKELLTEISSHLDSNTYLFNRGDYFIVKYLNKLDTTSNERLYNKIFSFYKKLKHKTKIKIEKYSREINTYVATKKLLEKKLDLPIKADSSTKSLNIENEYFLKTLSDIIENSKEFLNKLTKEENVVTDRLKYLHLSKEEREEHDKKTKILKKEAAKRLKDIDKTWDSITESESSTDEKFEIKQKILRRTQEYWDLFRNIFYNKSDKEYDLNTFNRSFFNTNAKFLKKELNISISKNEPYDSLINFFEKNSKEREKGDIFKQLKYLKKLQFFKLDRRIYIEENFSQFMNKNIEYLFESYDWLLTDTKLLIKSIYKISLFSRTNESSKIDNILSIIDKLNKQTYFLMGIENKPDFLIIKLERTRQILNKLKKEISVRLGSAFVEEHELLPVFKENALQKHSYLNFFKEFSLAEKVAEFLSGFKTDKKTFPGFGFSLDDLKSAIVRYEYYLTFPFFLTKEKESVITPKRGVNRYCRSVFANKAKDDWCLDLCSEKAELFPFIIWATSVSASTEKTEEQPIFLQPTKPSRNTLFEMLILVLIVAVLLVFIFIIIRFYKSAASRKNRRRRFADRQKLEIV